MTFGWRAQPGGGCTGPQTGLITDEVRKVLPAWVGHNPKGYQTLTVAGFKALTGEVLCELREEKDRQLAEREARVEALRAHSESQMKQLREKNAEIQSRLARIEAFKTQSTQKSLEVRS